MGNVNHPTNVARRNTFRSLTLRLKEEVKFDSRFAQQMEFQLAMANTSSISVCIVTAEILPAAFERLSV
eukprot:1176801-Prorocentrum_minimum.AAC.3